MKILNFVLVLIAILSLSACTHGLIANKDSASEDSTFALKKVWVKKTLLNPDEGYRKTVRMTPLLTKERVVQGNANDGIVSFDRKSGQKIWSLPLSGGVEGGVTQIKDRLFFGSNDGYFYSVSSFNGEVIWKLSVRSETLAAPLLYDGIVYFLTGNNVLHAVDASDGRELWIYSRVDNQNFSIRGAATPTVKDGSLILGFSDGYLVSLDSKTGSLKWETLLNKNKRFRDLDSTPVIDGDFVYVTGYDSHLYCVKVKSGELAWKLEPGGFGKTLVIEDRLFYSTSGGEVLAINKKLGTILWRFKLKEGIATSPMVYKKYLVFGESDGALRVLHQETGKEITHLTPGHGIFSPIAVDEEQKELFFISNSALLYKVKILEKIDKRTMIQ